MNKDRIAAEVFTIIKIGFGQKMITPEQVVAVCDIFSNLNAKKLPDCIEGFVNIGVRGRGVDKTIGVCSKVFDVEINYNDGDTPKRLMIGPDGKQVVKNSVQPHTAMGEEK